MSMNPWQSGDGPRPDGEACTPESLKDRILAALTEAGGDAECIERTALRDYLWALADALAGEPVTEAELMRLEDAATYEDTSDNDREEHGEEPGDERCEHTVGGAGCPRFATRSIGGKRYCMSCFDCIPTYEREDESEQAAGQKDGY
jgi:hypothetical protein